MRRDSIIEGALAGVAANIAKEVLTWAMHFAGWVRYTFVHIAAGYFVDAKFLDSPVSLAIGFLNDFTVSAILGVFTLYLLKATGRDYAVIKGIGFGLLTYIIFYGLLMAMDVTRASLLTPLPNLLLFIPHVIFGGLTAFLLEHYAPSLRGRA